MTDTAQPAAAQDAGTSNDIRDTTEPPVPAAAPPPLLPDGLSDDNGKRAEANRRDTADDIVAADRTLERDVAASLRPPGEAASAQEWDAFYRQLGRPEAASDYEFAMPEGLAADFPYDESAAGHFAEWAHEAGLIPRQAQSLHDRFVGELNSQFDARRQVEDEAVDAAHAALVQAWGAATGERYKRNVELSNRAIRELGGDALEQALKDRGALTEDGAITEPAIAFMLQQAGERLFAEDSVVTGSRQGSNPFLAAGENITEQGRLLRNNPELARSMIQAANREHEFPRLFGNEF